MSQEQYDAGLRERKGVLGAEYVDKALAAADSFNREFQRMVTEYCWGGTWGRGVLSRRDRSLLNLVILSALNRPHEFKIHMRGALTNGCTLEEIREILADCREDIDIVAHLERQKAVLASKLRHYQDVVKDIDGIIKAQLQMREEEKMSAQTYEIGERHVDPMLVAGIRMQGYYSDCGKGFATLFKRLGRHVAGKPLCLFYDCEYREGDVLVLTFPSEQDVAGFRGGAPGQSVSELLRAAITEVLGVTVKFIAKVDGPGGRGDTSAPAQPAGSGTPPAGAASTPPSATVAASAPASRPSNGSGTASAYARKRWPSS